MASIFQQIGSALGLSNSEPSVSGNTVTSSTTNAAFHLDIQQSGTVGEQVLVADQRGATIVSEQDQRAIIIGGTGNDHLVGGGHADLLIGGGGTNAMTGNGGADTFGHGAGARDAVTDFSPAAGEHIALQSGITLTGSTAVMADPHTFGLSGSPVSSQALSFSDGSHMTLLGVTETPTSDWFV